MRKILILIGFTVLLYSCLSEANRNFNNLKKVEIGMTMHQVDSIMKNKPKTIEKAFWDDNLFVYYYNSGFGASDDFSIVFSKRDSLVTSIGFGD